MARGFFITFEGLDGSGKTTQWKRLETWLTDAGHRVVTLRNPGSTLLCDRYTDSSEAYQGGGRQLGAERVLALHAAVCDNLQPDLTILLLPDLAESLARARVRNTEHLEASGTDENRFEREGDAFYQRIHAAYEAIAAREPQRVAVIRGGGLDEVERQVREIVARRMAEA
jgi:dTMP kinase